MPFGKLIKESNYTLSWFDVLFDATNILNTTHSTVINKSPYIHVYHQEVPRNEFQVDVEEDQDSEEDNSDTGSEDEPYQKSLEDVYESMVRSIDKDSEMNYIKNADRMKKSFDKRFALFNHSIGDIIALRVPEDVSVRGESNKLLCSYSW